MLTFLHCVDCGTASECLQAIETALDVTHLLTILGQHSCQPWHTHASSNANPRCSMSRRPTALTAPLDCCCAVVGRCFRRTVVSLQSAW